MRCSLGANCKRRTQTAAVLLFNWPSTLLLGLGTLFFIPWMFGIYGVTFMAIYLVFILLIDKAPDQGGRKSTWIRQFSAPLYRTIGEYFPVRLVKTINLDPTKQYIFGYHPHGILSVGAFINFGSEATNFGEVFPGIDVRLLTLRSNLLVPFHREWCMAHGAAVASRKCVSYCLSHHRSVLLVLGGAAESLRARPGTFDLTLQRRTGFIRLAFEHGAHLVPVICFGENDVFGQMDNPEGSLVRSIQERVRRLLGFAPPFIQGRGIFNRDAPDIGLLPFRHPVTTVVGAPIPVEQTDEPTTKQIKDLQRKYMTALKDLFMKHRKEYAPNLKADLRFVD